jgi:hypothetical protein
MAGLAVCIICIGIRKTTDASGLRFRVVNKLRCQNGQRLTSQTTKVPSLLYMDEAFGQQCVLLPDLPYATVHEAMSLLLTRHTSVVQCPAALDDSCHCNALRPCNAITTQHHSSQNQAGRPCARGCLGAHPAAGPELLLM